MSQNADQNFNDIANKFDRNIYGTTKGRLRHELLLHHLAEHILTPELGEPAQVRILDVGGGTGEMTKTLLQMGYDVTISDISDESLQIAREKCGEFQRLDDIHCGLMELPTDKTYDVVICHAVLEWLKEPQQAVEHLSKLLNKNGYLSLSFFNMDAYRFGNMLYGNFDFVSKGMPRRNNVRLSPHSPLPVKSVQRWLASSGFSTIHQAGIRCFHDYLHERQHRVEHYDSLKALEISYGSQEPYLWLGKYFQIIAKT